MKTFQMINGEIWKPVTGYEDRYLVSNKGRVFSLIYKKVLLPKDEKGYKRVMLSKDCKMKGYLVHRLVASEFLPNPLNLPFVNHIDENKANNCVKNLEWCTAKYNSNYGTRSARIGEKLSKVKILPVAQYDLDWNLVRVFPDKESFEGTPYIRKNCVTASSSGKPLYGYYWKTMNNAA